MSYAEILRCQVRVVGSEGYTACGAEAAYFEIRRPGGELPDEDYGFLACGDHASSAAEEIGMKSNSELRDLVRFKGAEPAF